MQTYKEKLFNLLRAGDRIGTFGSPYILVVIRKAVPGTVTAKCLGTGEERCLAQGQVKHLWD